MRLEAKLTEVRETLQRVERHQQSRLALQQAIAAMEQALADNKPGEAYATHAKLAAEHPELVGDAALAEMIQKSIVAERAAIRFVSEEQAAETSERPTPWVAALTVAHRRSATPVAGQNGVVCVRVDDAAYGLEASTGRVLWRRQVGYAAAPPLRIGEDVLTIDAKREELLRLNAATGELRWRQVIGEPFAQPLIVENRAFAAAESGRLFVIDLQSGARMGFVQFAQPLRVTPTVNPHQQRLYLAGDRASVYSISLADLTCAGVYYLGHSEGSIRVPLALVLDKLAVLENDGVETSRFGLLSLDAQGIVESQVAERRLTGSATSAPLVAGRRMVVVTDRGQLDVYDIGSAEGAESLAVIASRPATGTQPAARHAAIVGQSIWTGDSQLTKFAISPTGNRLPVQSIESDYAGAVFDHPLIALGNTLIHVRRPKGHTGAVVAATDTTQGKALWETQLGMPPAGPPIVDATAKTLAAANAEGFVFRFDEAAIRSRVQDQPLATTSRPANPPALTTAVDLGRGRAVFCAAGSNQVLLYDPAQRDRSLAWIPLPSPLACRVTPLGDGFLAPLEVGQVFYLSASDGTDLVAPFQPRLQPRTTVNYRPAAVVDSDKGRFVITDGKEKIYLLAMVEQPSAHLEAVAEASAGPYPIETQLIVLEDTALAVAGQSHLMRFRLPSLEPAGDMPLSAPVVWGPFRVGDSVLLATADEQLSLFSSTGEELWRAPLEHGDLAGTPLRSEDALFVAYRNGVIERRAISDGKSLASVDVQHSLAAGPVEFLQRIVVTANDGTLLVVDRL
jgi:outer membrane protein assembly factor BamB